MALQPAPVLIRVCEMDSGVTFMVEGRATMHQGHALRQFADDAVLRGCTRFRVDLRRCTYMDSTFIGTLLLLHRRSKDSGGLDVLCPSTACQKLLGDMCLDRVLVSSSANELPDSGWFDLPTQAEVTRPFAANIFEAHQALAELPGPAGAQFQGVVQCLAKDIELCAESK